MRVLEESFDVFCTRSCLSGGSTGASSNWLGAANECLGDVQFSYASHGRRSAEDGDHCGK